jgi:hypothetical protein
VKELLKGVPEVECIPQESSGSPCMFWLLIVVRFHPFCGRGTIMNERRFNLDFMITLQEDLSRVVDVQVSCYPDFGVHQSEFGLLVSHWP